MLVLEPAKRYTIPQIKTHRWMIGTADSICPIVNTTPSALQEPNEQILRLMHSLGIDVTRTKDVSILYRVKNPMDKTRDGENFYDLSVSRRMIAI